jgi:hypothetical protein
MHKEAVAKLLGTGSAEDFSTLSFELEKLAWSGEGTYVEGETALATLGKRKELEGLSFWEGRLGDREGYGVVASKRGGEEAGVGDMRVVEVGEVAVGARLARADSA